MRSWRKTTLHILHEVAGLIVFTYSFPDYITHGFNPWLTYGLLMVYSRFTHSLIMVYSWFTHGALTI